MLKKEILFENLDGETVSETFYFRMSKPDLIKMNVGDEGGMASMIEKVTETQGHQALLELFDKFIRLSVGRREGQQFIKNDDIADEFMNTPAYDSLFMELAVNEGAVADFLKGILPSEYSTQIDEMTAKGPEAMLEAMKAANEEVKKEEKNIDKPGFKLPPPAELPGTPAP